MENLDYGIIINPEIDPTNNEEYLGFKLIASRSKKTPVIYFLQKFENPMKLEEDFNLDMSLAIENMASTRNEFNPNVPRKFNKNENKSFKKIEQVKDEEEELNI